MGFEHEVPTIDLNKEPSTIQVRYADSPQGGTNFYVSIPEGYLYPTVPEDVKKKDGNILPAPGFIKKFQPHLLDDLEVSINNHTLRFDFETRLDFHLFFHSYINEEFWGSSYKLPNFINEIVAEALCHEASINPNIGSSECLIDIRLPRSDNDRWSGKNAVNYPHFDGHPGAKNSFYFLTSPPTTVVYTGPYQHKIKNHPATETFTSDGGSKMTPSSMLPWTLMHADQTVLHSQPWELFPSQGGTDPRFFIRISFQY
jgi:hypothetical protein